MPIKLDQARKWADHLVGWLAPHCHRVEVAGSIRRGRPYVNDVDIVCIPKTVTTRDMFGKESDRFNAAFEFVRNAVNEGKCKPGLGCKGEGKQMIVYTPKVQLDLWFATEETWATRFMMRTGSKEHNIWIAERAKSKNLHWQPYEGLGVVVPDHPPGACSHKFVDSKHCLLCGRIPTIEEAHIYKALDLPFIEPANREIDWLKANVHD